MEPQLITAEISYHTVVLMGICFMLGSLCTIFILLILDMVRLARANQLERLEQMRPEEPEDRDAA